MYTDGRWEYHEPPDEDDCPPQPMPDGCGCREAGNVSFICKEHHGEQNYPWGVVRLDLNTEDITHNDLSMWYDAMEELRQEFIAANGLPEHAFELIPYSC